MDRCVNSLPRLFGCGQNVPGWQQEPVSSQVSQLQQVRVRYTRGAFRPVHWRAACVVCGHIYIVDKNKTWTEQIVAQPTPQQDCFPVSGSATYLYRMCQPWKPHFSWGKVLLTSVCIGLQKKKTDRSWVGIKQNENCQLGNLKLYLGCENKMSTKNRAYKEFELVSQLCILFRKHFLRPEIPGVLLVPVRTWNKVTRMTVKLMKLIQQ